MTKITSILIIISLFTARVYCQNSDINEVNAHIIPNQQWVGDLEFVVAKLKEVHPCLYCKTSPEKFSETITNARNLIEQSHSDVECFFAIGKIIALLQDGHTNLFLSGKIDFTAGKFPILFDYFYDGYYVTAVEERNNELIGLKLLAVNGIPVESIIQQLLEISSRDNNIGRMERAVSYLRYPLMLQGAGIQTAEGEMIYTFIGKESKPFSKTIHSSYTKEDDLCPVQKLLGSATPLHLKNLQKNYWFENLPDNKAVYVQINRIENQSRRDLFSKFTADLFENIDRQHHIIEKVIIDLRYNGGGSGRLAVPFIKEIIKRDKINTRGNLYVIIGQKTFSAAIVMATGLLEYTEAIFVGSQSACAPNMFSNSTSVGNLPNSGLGLSVASRQIDNGWISNREYFKIDVPVLMSGQDYFSGADPALDIILKDEAIPLQDLAALKGADEAFAWYNRIMEKYPEMSWWSSSQNLEATINEKGYKMIEMSQLDKAEQLLELNTMLFPDSWNVWDSAAEIYYLNGKKNQCIKALEKSLELNPDNKNAQEGLKQLKK